jgi:hypothetical protein
MSDWKSFTFFVSCSSRNLAAEELSIKRALCGLGRERWG